MAFEFPNLQRPQYPSSPEVLLSALAWSVVPRSDEGSGVGLIYQRSRGRKPRGVVIEQTMPRDQQELEGFRERLQANGWPVPTGGGLRKVVAEAVTDALLGGKPLSSRGRASSAIGLAGALLQDPVGGLSTRQPPNFAHLLNTMYVLGGEVAGQTAARRWFEAASY